MKFNGQILLVIVAGLMAIIVGWFYQERMQQRDSSTAELEIPDNIDYYFTDMTYRVVRDSGETDYVFESPRLEHRVRGDTSHIQQPAVTIYRDNAIWTLNAETGKLKHATEVLKLQQQVTMQKQGQQSLRLESEQAVFESKAEIVTFPSTVLITSDDARISATSATLDVKNNVYRFNQARTVYYDKTS